MTNQPGVLWHVLPPQDAIRTLQTNPEHGLSAAEVTKRIEQYGKNELAEAPRPTFWQRLLAQFNNFVIYILIFATIVSALLGDTLEAVVIAAIVVLNAILGVVQEGRAEKALEALKKLAAPNAKVRRDGHTQSIPAADLVPGDVVLIEAGDYIPADVRLIESANLKVEEAALTGESVPVDKHANRISKPDSTLGDRHNMAYMGTVATYGRGKAVVIATGMKTEMGKIATALQNTEEEETPLQRRLNGLGRTLSIGALAICAVVFAVNALIEINKGGEVINSLKDSFIIAISLAIAAVPEGLPAIVTINLAIGMREMIRRNALIRRLPAVETLGSATMICSDKTGTLTQNQMTVARVFVDNCFVEVTGEGYNPVGQFRDPANKDQIVPESRPTLARTLLGGLLCTDARLEQTNGLYRIAGDPTEGALVVLAAKGGLTRETAEKAYPRVEEIPFDSDRKRMTTVHHMPEGHFMAFVKGALDEIVTRCTTALINGQSVPMDDTLRAAFLNANKEMASQALRVLGVAQRRMQTVPKVLTPETIEVELEMIGLVGMIDPARPEVKPAIATARGAGIRTAMITGDYPDTAKAIATEIGLLRTGGEVVTGGELEKMTDDELRQRVKNIDVFARVSPHHKVRIVEAFQANNQVVAMTGDGMNDAPALKRANIGVAMGITGTDVSKASADMILTDDNYASIVSAVEQGRVIYGNIRKFVYYLLTCNLAEIGVIFLGTLIGWGAPLTAIQLLWLNLVTDGAPALALGVEKGDPDIMQQPPRPPNEPIINRDMQIGMVVQTIAKTVCTLWAYAIGIGALPAPLLSISPSPARATTMAFATLAIAELGRAYTSRSELNSLWSIGFFSNLYMQIAVGLSLVGMFAVMYIPFLQQAFDTVTLGVQEWLVMLPLILAPSVLAEITKIFLRQTRPAPTAA